MDPELAPSRLPKVMGGASLWPSVRPPTPRLQPLGVLSFLCQWSGVSPAIRRVSEGDMIEPLRCGRPSYPCAVRADCWPDGRAAGVR
jgi:hypothetical protein